MADKTLIDRQYTVEETGRIANPRSLTILRSELDILSQIQKKTEDLTKAIEKVQKGYKLTENEFNELEAASVRYLKITDLEVERTKTLASALTDALKAVSKRNVLATSVTGVLRSQLKLTSQLLELEESGDILSKRSYDTFRKTLGLKAKEIETLKNQYSIVTDISQLDDETQDKLRVRGVLEEDGLSVAKKLLELKREEGKLTRTEYEEHLSVIEAMDAQYTIGKQLLRQQEETNIATRITKQVAGPLYTPIQKVVRKFGGSEVADKMQAAKDRAAKAAKSVYSSSYGLAYSEDLKKQGVTEENATVDQKEQAAAKASGIATKEATAAARNELKGVAASIVGIIAKTVLWTAAIWTVAKAFKGTAGLAKAIGNGIKAVFVGLGNLAKNAFNKVVGLAKTISGRIQGFFRSVWARMMEISGPAADLIRTIGVASTKSIGPIRAAGQDSIEKMNNLREIAESIEVDPVTFFNTDDISTAVSLKKQLGLTAEQAGNLALRSKMAGVSAEGYEKYVDQAYQTSQKQSNLEGGRYRITTNLSQINKKLLGTSNEMAVSFGLNNKRLTDAVMQATKLGLEIEDIKGIANNLLDFESSIGSEMEAQLLTGQQMNLNQARLAALQGDYVALGQELEKQNITAERYGEMNLVQRNAVAKALGMSNDQLAKMLIQQSKSTNLSDEAKAHLMGMTLEQYKAVSLQDSWNNQLNAMKEAFIPVISKFLPIILSALKSVLSLAQKIAPVLVKAVDKVLPLVSRLWDLVSGLIDKVLQADFSPILGFLEKAISAVGVLVGSMSNAFKGREKKNGEATLNSPAAQLGTGIGVIAKSVVDVLKEVGPAVVQALTTIIPVIANVVRVLAPVAAKFIEGLGKLIVGLLKGIGPVLDRVVPVLESIAEPLVDALLMVFDGVVPVITALLDAVLPAIKPAIEALAPVITELIAAIAPVIQGLVSLLTPIIQILVPVIKVAATILSSIGNLLVAIAPSVLSLVRSLAPHLISILGTVGGVIQRLMPLVAAVINTLLPIITGIINAIMPSITTLVGILGDIIGIGLNILTPILNTVGPVLGHLIEVIGSVIGFIVNLPGQIFHKLTSWLVTLTDKLTNLPILKQAQAWCAWLGGWIAHIAKVVTEIPTMLFGNRQEKEELKKAREQRLQELEGLKAAWKKPISDKTEPTTATGGTGPAMATGGIVPGNSYTGDNVPIRTNSGEMVLTQEQQGNLFKLANSGLEANYLASQNNRETSSREIAEIKEEVTNLISEIRKGFNDQVKATKESRTTINCDWDWVKFDSAYSRNIALS